MGVEENRFRSHVDPAIYGIFRRIFHLAKKNACKKLRNAFPVEASGFTCSGHVYDEKLPPEQKKEYVSMATGKLEKIHPGAYMYLLFRAKGNMFEKARFLHERILSINTGQATARPNPPHAPYKVIVESINPSVRFPPAEKDIETFEYGHRCLLVRYELKFLKPLKKITPDEAREAFRHFWQQFSDLVWSYEPWKLFRKREIIAPEWFSCRGLGDELLFE